MKAEEVHINSKIMELKYEVSQRTQVPAKAKTWPKKALPNKIQLNRKIYTATQSDNGLEPLPPQECMAGILGEKT